jgi:hypothetical protein
MRDPNASLVETYNAGGKPTWQDVFIQSQGTNEAEGLCQESSPE